MNELNYLSIAKFSVNFSAGTASGISDLIRGAIQFGGGYCLSKTGRPRYCQDSQQFHSSLVFRVIVYPGKGVVWARENIISQVNYIDINTR